MRLIDADKLKYCHITKAVMSPTGFAMLKIINIDDISTAFDSESVIAELEKKTIDELGIDKVKFEMDKEEYSSYCTLTLHDVIKILKSAANDTNGKIGG